jgi:hypothetical protein
MKGKLKRPSPAMIVAIAALIAGLAGTAVALPGKNSVKKDDIARDAVTNKHTKFWTKGPFRKASAAASEAAAPRITLLRHGPLTIYGKCFDDGAGNIVARTYIRTSKSNAVFAADNGEQNGDPPLGYLNPGDLEADRILDASSVGANDADVEDPDDTAFVAAQGKTALEGDQLIAAKQGTLPAGNGIYGAGDRCLFEVYAAHTG